MDNRAEIRDFLATRRAKVMPQQVGLPAGGGHRRVPGLRREEVAVLSGVSTEWYTRLEKGHISGVSQDVLDAVARALMLDEAEREHLSNLARAARTARRTPVRRRTATELPTIPASLQRVLDSMNHTAAFVRNGRLDVLASNALGRALYAPVLGSAEMDLARRPANIARFSFLDPAAADYFPDLDGALAVTVALLRTEAGRHPFDRELTDLVGELATRSEEFRVLWGAHDVRRHPHGTKQFRHPLVGFMELQYDSMSLVLAPDLVLTAYTAEPATASADALTLLASWAASDMTSGMTSGMTSDGTAKEAQDSGAGRRPV